MENCRFYPKRNLLHAAKFAGYNVHGVEIVPEVIEPFLRENPDLSEQVFAGKFEDVSKRFSDKQFDIITGIDVIEHFERPLVDMQTIADLLREGGHFIFQTPDTECGQNLPDRSSWGALKPVEHLQLFDRRNIIPYMQQFGFNDVQLYEPFEVSDGNFTAIARKS